MKIDYVGGAYVPGRGADSVHQMHMCEALASLGHQVTLHARRGLEASSNDHAFYGCAPNFAIVKHARPTLRGVGALINAALVARSVGAANGSDLVYGREIYGLACSIGASKLPFVFESHWNPKHRVQFELESWLFRRSNFHRVVFISEALRRIYFERFPWLPEHKTLVAHDAANVRALPPRTVPTERMQVGYVGGFLPGYGIDIVEQLARSHPAHDFHVLGGAPDALLAWRAKAQRVPNLTMHGFVPPGELPARYANFDVLLAPYQDTTAHIRWISPMKLFEYMSYGKPLICSDFPVMHEIVRNEVDGLLVPASSLPAWSAALTRLADPGLRRRLGASAAERLAAEFTWSRRAARVLEGLG